ncbi:unnamed protein product [Effrenium voratum]|nr:unnamed protein product [Effrenium voratum]
MQNNGQMLDAKLKYVPIPIRSDRRTAKIQHVSYPTLPLSSWVECLFREEPRLLLGGCDLGDEGFREVLGVFWQRYRGTDPGLPLFAEDVDTSFCIPYMLHGDEGRGKVRRQVMVLSFQPMISFKGLSHLNTSGHSFTTRLVYTVIRGELYAPDGSTLDTALWHLVQDLQSMYEQGFPDWWDLRPESLLRQWSVNVPAESPFKTTSFSPLRALPGMDCPSKILIDPAHTFAIQGFGKDMAASCTVLLGVHMGVFGGNNIGEKLDLAFISFKDFCKRAGKLQQYPRGCGKGFDAAVLCRWLMSVVDGLPRDQVDPLLKSEGGTMAGFEKPPK